MTKYKILVTEDVDKSGQVEVAGTRAVVNDNGDLTIHEDRVVDNWLGTSRIVMSVSRGHWTAVEDLAPKR